MFEPSSLSVADRVADLDVDAALTFAAARRRAADRAEADLLAVAAHWADLHAVLPGEDADGIAVPGMQELAPLAGEGTPQVAEFAAAELGAALGMSTFAARRLVGDALELRHRLPRLWGRVQDRDAARPLQVWRARRLAERTTVLSPAAAARVDAQVAPFAHKIGLARVMSLVEAELIRSDPETAGRRAAEAAERRGVWADEETTDGTVGIRVTADALDAFAFEAKIAGVAEVLAGHGDTDPVQVRRAKAIGYLADPAALDDLLDRADVADAARGSRRSRVRLVLYVHLSEASLRGINPPGAVARVEGVGPVCVDQVRDWVTRGATSSPTGVPVPVVVAPVRDLADRTSVDAYETPPAMREVVLLRSPCCPFPWCDNLTRNKDMDHVSPYRPPDRGGPPGQTAPRQAHRPVPTAPSAQDPRRLDLHHAPARDPPVALPPRPVLPRRPHRHHPTDQPTGRPTGCRWLSRSERPDGTTASADPRQSMPFSRRPIACWASRFACRSASACRLS